MAIELSILSNFLINHQWTWRNHAEERSVWNKLLRYHVAVAGTAFFSNYVILIGLTEFMGIHYLQSNLIGILIGTVSNYLINDRWTFRTETR
jgi:dolichol-phosphate mannosyltransferase